jgi:hypothetical protein
MAKSDVAPLTIANLAMLERQLNNNKVVKRRASRKTLSRQSAMTSEVDMDDDDDDVRSRRTSTRQGRDSCKIL